MNYIIDFKVDLPDSCNFCASKKAPADVEKTLHSIGAETKYLVLPVTKFRAKKWAVKLRNVLQLLSCFSANDQIFVQGYGYGKDVYILTTLAKCKGVRVNYIVHDINFLRWDRNRKDNKEIKFLNNFDCLYIHTEAMELALKQRGITTEMKIMHIFDYYSDDPMMPKDEILGMKNVMAFAGNLDKSKFLEPWAETSHLDNISGCLYGISQDVSKLENSNIRYMCAFKPNNTGTLKAGWGLLWDGDSTNTCAGELGEYLRVNSSHKLSLYLACGMPIILWSESSLADWLNKQGVCLTVNSLDDIPNAINNISEEQYSEMIDNSIKLGLKLRNGELLKLLLPSAEQSVGGGNLAVVLCKFSVMSNHCNKVAA